MGAYSGNLVRKYAAPNDIQPQYPSPAHAGGDHGTQDLDFPHRDAKLVDPGTSADYGTPTMPTYDNIGGGFILMDPTGSHASEGVTNVGAPNKTDEEVYADWLSRQGQIHGDPNNERGPVNSSFERETPMQFNTENYSDTLIEGFKPMAPNVPALNRSSGRAGWAYPQANPDQDVQPRPGLIRQTTTHILRRQHRRQYRYSYQPLTQRNAGVAVSSATTAQKKSLGSEIQGWKQLLSAHQFNQRPGVWNDPGLVDDSLLAANPGMTPDTTFPMTDSWGV